MTTTDQLLTVDVSTMDGAVRVLEDEDRRHAVPHHDRPVHARDGRGPVHEEDP